MTTYKKIDLSAKNLKKGMKVYGINVLMCRQNKQGVNIAVDYADTEKAIKFFNEFDLKQYPSKSMILHCSLLGCKGVNNFGTLFKYEKI